MLTPRKNGLILFRNLHGVYHQFCDNIRGSAASNL